ncbi:acetyl-CoA carboxylase biotin carboxyl carrier protein [Hyphobacterium sp. CCMP332]|nr:acetyl-CoA carboxylase biotin carboxyl carrier protein [Hyphobacterium sp. CCMP332]
MKAKEIQDLIEFISTCGMDEVNIETDQIKLHVKKHGETQVVSAPAPVQNPAPQAAAPSPAPSASAPAPTQSTADEDSKYVAIKAPMIGTFYRSPNPESPSFVNVGDKVEAGQTICIIEAMKLFNEIESDVSGTVVKVVADNSSPVEYDQVLFLIDPS